MGLFSSSCKVVITLYGVKSEWFYWLRVNMAAGVVPFFKTQNLSCCEVNDEDVIKHCLIRHPKHLGHFQSVHNLH